MANSELSEKELLIYKKVLSLDGSMEEKSSSLKEQGIFQQYKNIHQEYFNLINSEIVEKEKNEALKRIIFLNWYHMIEPSCFTGLWELDGDIIHSSYLILNDKFMSGKVDDEFKWMISYYSANDWTILLFSEDMLELTNFVKNVDSRGSHLPQKNILKTTMDDRGQMGEYFKTCC